MTFETSIPVTENFVSQVKTVVLAQVEKQLSESRL